MYMQQYYDRQSLKTSDRLVRSFLSVAACRRRSCVLKRAISVLQFISIACLFLACKVWDAPRSLDTMVKACWHLVCLSLDGQMVGSGSSRREITPEEKEKEKIRIQDQVRFLTWIRVPRKILEVAALCKQRLGLACKTMVIIVEA
jgi:hypothetical protein